MNDLLMVNDEWPLGEWRILSRLHPQSVALTPHNTYNAILWLAVVI